MKKSLFKLVSLLTSGLFLFSCGMDNDGDQSEKKSEPTVTESSQIDSVGTTSLPEEAAKLIVANNEDSPMPTYDEATKTYFFEVAAAKRSYTINGEFEGRFLVKDTTLEEYKGITFKLNNATLTNNAADGSVFVYEPHSKAITIEAIKGTANSVSSTGIAINATNNVNLCGDGTMSVKSNTNHAVRGDDIRCYDALTLNVEGSGKDGLHGKRFYSDDGGDGAEKKNFTGSINLKAIAKQAFDFVDEDDWSGAINLSSTTTVNVTSCENVFKSDSKIVLDGKVEATGITDKAITKDKANANNLLVLVSGQVSFNGTVLSPNSYNY